MEETEVVETYSKPTNVTAIVSTVIALGVGIGVGYVLGKRQRKFTHAVPPVQDWDLSKLESVPDISENEEETDDVAALIADHADTPVSSTIFADIEELPEWDYQVELAKRTEDGPYIIHRDEYYNNEREFHQTTLTYYASDDILCDEESKPIYNHTQVTGPLNFGYGSGDQNVFYVRNVKLRAEYEVLKDGGFYSVEVLGHEMEDNARATDLKHSSHRKFRTE